MGFTDSISIGRDNIASTKMMMEAEQEVIAKKIMGALEKQGYTVDFKFDGKYTVMAGVIPMRLDHIKIYSVKRLSDDGQKKFEDEKARLALEFGKQRQEIYKKEKERLKAQEKKKK